ncbi:MAG: ATP-dependent metallopeptidase FtsH/Yme1/Tma family protein [Geminicoccaceae bacterium]|nr:MAG: ATP-dependent metallopeptidase FtsH/Yme1/Tma family protein [Geminicoccaceae bacterium]
MERQQNFSFWYLVAALILILAFQSLLEEQQRYEQITYSTFERYLEQARIDDLVVSENRITGRIIDPDPDHPEFFSTIRVDPDFAAKLEAAGVEFRGSTESSTIAVIASWVLPMLLFFAIWMFLIRRMASGGLGGGGLMSVGKSRAKIYVERDTKKTFDDVAGVDEAKAEVREIVDFLREPERYARLGARMPKGVLLVGPPGTGKTLLARAMAGEAGVTFLSISGSEFVEMFVGVGAARVRDLFEKAREHAPCIIFIDELDALGRARGAGPMTGGHDEKEQTLNQLLVELDGFDTRQGIVLLAATNRPELLDPALLRAGRFDRQVLVDRPDRTGRKAILQVHVRGIRLDPRVSIDDVAALTPGFTGADLANLVNEAALLATRADRPAVTYADFEQAVERIVAGLEKRNRLLNPLERKTVAYHEMGHALVALSLKGVDPVQKVSIIPRGIGALGYTLQRPTEDRYLMHTAELENKMAVLLAGRAAEELVFGEISTGAADDLQRVTEIARAMVTRYGMVQDLGQAALETETGRFLGAPIEGGGRRFSETTAREIDLAVKRLIDDAYARAKQILGQRRDDLERYATLLLERETLSAEELPAPGVFPHRRKERP